MIESESSGVPFRNMLRRSKTRRCPSSSARYNTFCLWIGRSKNRLPVATEVAIASDSSDLPIFGDPTITVSPSTSTSGITQCSGSKRLRRSDDPLITTSSDTLPFLLPLWGAPPLCILVPRFLCWLLGLGAGRVCEDVVERGR